MVRLLQVVSILLASVGMALALAHTLEFPGKRRLDRDTCLKVQAIYYPGFTGANVRGQCEEPTHSPAAAKRWSGRPAISRTSFLVSARPND
jgi:hypothetical protein